MAKIDFKFNALGLAGRRFRLKGRAAEFIVRHDYHAAGVIPAVVGRTPDNRFQTAARVEDVDWLDEPAKAADEAFVDRMLAAHRFRRDQGAA